MVTGKCFNNQIVVNITLTYKCWLKTVYSQWVFEIVVGVVSPQSFLMHGFDNAQL